MPITAERMQNIITIAIDAVEKSERAKSALESILNDIGSVRTRLNGKEVEDEVLDELVFSIETLARDARLVCTLPAETIKNLGSEQTWFKINQAKHKSQAQRMRILRKGKNNRTSDTINVALMIEEEMEERKRIGKERHEEKGPCNSNGEDGECSECKRIEDRLEKPEDEVFDHESWLPKEKVKG